MKDSAEWLDSVKLLLLGAGESGKSTFLKQMRIIHGINFEPELIKEYQHVIYQNIVKGMQVLCDARDKLDIPWEHPTSQLAANEAVMFHSGCLLDAEQFHQYVPLINILWTDGAIRKAYDRRREFQISASICR
uniref:G-protein alpha subunit n=1 Tax=Anopheles epiroticus TaxID=199890 RepID=A0A182P7F6_9DIPT